MHDESMLGMVLFCTNKERRDGVGTAADQEGDKKDPAKKVPIHTGQVWLRPSENQYGSDYSAIVKGQILT